MKYFIQTTSIQAKNALQRAIYDYIKTFENRTVEKQDEILKNVETHIKRLNAVHHRCTSASVTHSFDLFDNRKMSTFINVGTFYCYMHLYPILGEVEDDPGLIK